MPSARKFLPIVAALVVVLALVPFLLFQGGEMGPQPPPRAVGDFEISGKAEIISFFADERGLFSIEIKSLNGFDSSVKLSVRNPPPGIKIQFDKAGTYKVAPNGVSVAGVSFELVDESALGERNLTFVGRSTEKSHLFNATLDIIGKGTILLNIRDFSFLQKRVTVLKGTTVRWHNNDDVFHSVTSISDLFDNGVNAQAVVSYHFNDEGDFNYFCRPHPWMTGAIRVIS